jgi:peptidoglycan-associated lipoprotein
VASTPERPPDADAEKAQREKADLERILDGTVLHFGFDEANLTAESRERLNAIAAVLRERPALVVRVAGNCDERGTEEYNLALGERRASAAKKYLVDLGIGADRIGTISYGKEHPAAIGHDERAWAQNRRDEFQPTRGL